MPNEWQPVVPQYPMVQAAVMQSPGTPQVLKSVQRGQVVEPPQSTSVSPWFFTPSVHDGAAHRPEVQTPLSQSLPTLQIWFSVQRLQSAPPQSTSDSLPFRTVSVQLAATQTFALQMWLAQSVVA